MYIFYSYLYGGYNNCIFSLLNAPISKYFLNINNPTKQKKRKKIIIKKEEATLAT